METQGFKNVESIPGVIVRPIKRFSDNRGWLMELFRDDEPNGAPPVAMGYISMTNPGVGRGPHEHIGQSDSFFFTGPGEFMLVLWDNRPESPQYRGRMVIRGGGDTPCQVVVSPRVVHGYRCVSNIPGVVINLPDRLYRGPGKKEEVDEVRHETDPSSPFVIDFNAVTAVGVRS